MEWSCSSRAFHLYSRVLMVLEGIHSGEVSLMADPDYGFCHKAYSFLLSNMLVFQFACAQRAIRDGVSTCHFYVYNRTTSGFCNTVASDFVIMPLRFCNSAASGFVIVLFLAFLIVPLLAL